MTGRGAGFCARYAIPGFMNPAWGRGGERRGWRHGGGGGGWGHRHWNHAMEVSSWQRVWMGEPGYTSLFPASFGPTITKDQALAALKNQAKDFEQVLNDLRDRIREIEMSEEGSKTT